MYSLTNGFYSIEDIENEQILSTDNTESISEVKSQANDINSSVDTFKDGLQSTDEIVSLTKTIQNLPDDEYDSNSVNASTAQVINVALESYCKKMNIKLKSNSYSFEDFSQKNRKTIKQITILSLEEATEKGNNTLFGFLKGIVDKISTFMSSIFTAKGRLQKRLINLKTLSKNANGIEINNKITTKLSINGQVDFKKIDDGVSYIKKISNSIFDDILEQALSFLSTVEKKFKESESKFDKMKADEVLKATEGIVKSFDDMEDFTDKFLNKNNFYGTENTIYSSKEILPGEKRLTIIVDDSVDKYKDKKGTNIMAPMKTLFTPLNNGSTSSVRMDQKNVDSALNVVENILSTLNYFDDFEKRISKYKNKIEILTTGIEGLKIALESVKTRLPVTFIVAVLVSLLKGGTGSFDLGLIIFNTLKTVTIGTAVSSVVTPTVFMGLDLLTDVFRDRNYFSYGNSMNRYIRLVTLFLISTISTFGDYLVDLANNILDCVETATKSSVQSNNLQIA